MRCVRGATTWTEDTGTEAATRLDGQTRSSRGKAEEGTLVDDIGHHSFLVKGYITPFVSAESRVDIP